MSDMDDVMTKEALATGEAFVTTLHDVRMVRDRAVAAEREACAKCLEAAYPHLAAMIRLRGNA